MGSVGKNSVISVDRDEADGQGSPTTLTEFAVVHRSRAGEDVVILPPPFPTPTPSSLSSPQTPSYPIPPPIASQETTPTTSLETPTYPAPPPLFSNSFQNARTEAASKVIFSRFGQSVGRFDLM